MASPRCRRSACSSSSSPGYMKTLGGSLVAGRDFTWDDAHGQRPVAMVSANLARELVGRPVARRSASASAPTPRACWREVVGVVSDTRDDGVTKKAPTVAYWPIAMANFSPGAGGSGLRPAQRRLPGAERAHRRRRIRPRAGAGGVGDQPEPAAGRRAHAAGDLRPVAGADVVHAGDARHRRRDGAAAGRGRHLRRHLLRGVAAPPRDRHPHRARRAAACHHRPVRPARHGARRRSAWRSAWPRRSASRG